MLYHVSSPLVVVGHVKVAWVVGVKVRWWLHWWPSSPLYSFRICTEVVEMVVEVVLIEVSEVSAKKC